ncbi:dihydrofolate reductase family protein [Amycolatopsis benzoatilytica]|uniref:dihydrofolate reductase family protein n=1 Tax=Amycolatopsis benzoatilytica TaxID=346045 RepID=UPI0003671F3A|nr:dihydrofolate reductase family protein [Amycolatopsis benzoatilytica]
MRKIIVSTLMTLDGVVEDPGGFGESPYGGWAPAYFGDEAAARSLAHLSTCDYLLCGRRTYELFAKAWPNASGPYADRLNSIPKLVASTTLTGDLDWNATVLEGDAVGALAELKRQRGGDLMLYGSATLSASLLRHGLVDELSVLVFPIVVGAGKRLFADGAPRVELKLVERDELDGGVAGLRYRPV